MFEFLLLLIFAVLFGLFLHGLHRKVIARVQNRPGPPIWQELLHTLKFTFKQTWIPKTASQGLYVTILLVAIGIWIAALWSLYAGLSILFLFAVYTMHKIVEHGIGLSSGSQYTKFGALRSVMSAASELPLLISIAILYVFTNTLTLSGIIAWQSSHMPLLLAAFPAAVAMYLVIISKTHYGPFTAIEGKELVSGYWTEHFSGWRGILGVSDSLKTFVLLAAFVMIFVGSVPFWLMLILMVILMVSISFVCAVTPMLTPFNAITIQMIWTCVVLAYGVVAWLLISYGVISL